MFIVACLLAVPVCAQDNAQLMERLDKLSRSHEQLLDYVKKLEGRLERAEAAKAHHAVAPHSPDHPAGPPQHPHHPTVHHNAGPVPKATHGHDVHHTTGGHHTPDHPSGTPMHAAHHHAADPDLDKFKDPVRPTVAPKQRPTLAPYGFVRMDMVHDSQRLNDRINPFFVLPRAPGSAGNDEYVIHARLSRLGMQYDQPGSTKVRRLDGRMEVDFDNGGSESREALRMRECYMRLWHGDLYILAGQTWDVIAPLIPSANAATLLWTSGNLGDRRPQVQVGWAPKRPDGGWTATLAAGLPGAIDAQDLDRDGQVDGEAGTFPLMQARVGYHGTVPKDPRSDAVSVGIWALAARQRTAIAVAGRRTFDSDGLGLDYTIPLTRRDVLRGELFHGQNLSDVRGNAGQSVGNLGHEIRGSGGWLEYAHDIRGPWSAGLGLGIDRPDRDNLQVGQRDQNRQAYIFGRWRYAHGWQIGADLINWKTGFFGGTDASATRLELSLLQTF